ncbi:MAG: AAA family ATPase, partial [Muribaculaceae bacterium]|nr:AAA family ATPase [Muribaculaceae bacterium]
MKYPIGIQSFKKIRTGGYVYVDKTAQIYNLMQQGQYFFLSRPRRFGKSLILSTMEAYFEGRKDLFEGLAIAELEKNWKALPVIHIDFNTGDYETVNGLLNRIDKTLTEQEEKHGQEKASNDSGLRFEYLIKNIYASTGNKVVLLIDEYDKPLLETIGAPDLQKKLRDELRDMYSVLKTCDEYIQFAMLTGVTKFGHLNVFSGLNNIKDISFRPEYAALCGITETEMLSCFDKPIQVMAEKKGYTVEEMVEKLRNMYDGYRFTRENILVYNPFSLLNAFDDKELYAYWFETGTPKYLVELLQNKNYKLNELEGATSYVQNLKAFNPDSGEDPLPVMYQSGYL